MPRILFAGMRDQYRGQLFCFQNASEECKVSKTFLGREDGYELESKLIQQCKE